MASDVIGLGLVGIVDCRIDKGKSFVVDHVNVGISGILRHVSHSMKMMNPAFIIGHSHERPTETCSVHSHQSQFFP